MRTPSNRTGPGYQGVVVSKPDIPSASSIGRSNCAVSPLLVLAILPLTVRIGRSEGWASDAAAVRWENAKDAAPANAAVTARRPAARLVKWIIVFPKPAQTPRRATEWWPPRSFPRENNKRPGKLQTKNDIVRQKQF